MKLKLKLRFLLLITAIFIVFMLIAWLISEHLVNQINQEWGRQYTERQVVFDKYRTLSPLIREIDLAKKMAADPAIVQMALHENDPAHKRRGIARMESYRFNFRDHSYFAAMARSGNYYFNDADNQFKGNQLRYVLSPHSANDKWFYATLADDKPYQVNIDPDVHLGITKAWINVLIKDGDETLGVIGTGINLSEFLKETVGVAQHGVHNFFIDKNLAIQLNNDPALIDYMSIAKDASQRVKVDVLLKNPADVAHLQQVMQALEKNPDETRTLWVGYEGGKNLLGVAYLPEIGWYSLTLMTSQNLELLEDKWLAPFLFGVAFLLALFILLRAMHVWVLRPIAALQLSADRIKAGHFDVDVHDSGSSEIGDLSRSFADMATNVRISNQHLEDKVRERTESLRATNEKMQHFLDSISEGVYGVDPDGICTFVNPALLEILGFQSADQVIGRHIHTLIHHTRADGSPYPADECKMYQAYRSNQSVHADDEVFWRADGVAIPVEYWSSPIMENGRVTGAIATFNNISERKRIDRLKNEFVSTVSHELRTPITAVSGSLGLIAGGALGELPAQVKQMIEIAHRNSTRLTVLINDLLDMEKLVAGKIIFDMQPQKLMPLIVQSIEENNSYGASRGVRLLLTDLAPEIMVSVDSQRLLQILSNLLSNAIKYSPDNGSVEISIRMLEGMVRVTVSDHGPGIPAEFRRRIFQKFSQADSSDTRQKGGTGLGLAISCELVERMGGKIGFDSIEGQGASFYFEMPVI